MNSLEIFANVKREKLRERRGHNDAVMSKQGRMIMKEIRRVT